MCLLLLIHDVAPFFVAIICCTCLCVCRYPIGKGADIFISVWNLHHSPHLWKDPEAFRPERFSEPFENPGFNGKWAGRELGIFIHACVT